MGLALNVTPEAEKAFRKLSLSKQGNYIRVTAGAGCNCGTVAFQMQWDLHKKFRDAKAVHGGVTIVVDRRSVPYLKQATIDFDESTMRTGFHITPHPNAPTVVAAQPSGGCGCGSGAGSCGSGGGSCGSGGACNCGGH